MQQTPSQRWLHSAAAEKQHPGQQPEDDADTPEDSRVLEAEREVEAVIARLVDAALTTVVGVMALREGERMREDRERNGGRGEGRGREGGRERGREGGREREGQGKRDIDR